MKFCKVNPEWKSVGPKADLAFRVQQPLVSCQGTPVPVLEVPREIFKAADKISRWFSEQGVERWELMDLCSRDHAFELAGLKGSPAYTGGKKKGAR